MTKITFETDKHLEIEGVRLKRGELATKRIRTLELADGSVVELPLIVVRGASPGPVL